MTTSILGDTPERSRTVHRRVRSTDVVDFSDGARCILTRVPF